MKRPFTDVISGADFLQLVQEHSGNFLKIHNFLRKAHKPYARKFYAHLIEESEELESFLDDHCARENKEWYLFSEFVACIRNVAKVMFILNHTINRYLAYELDSNATDGYLEKANEVSDFMTETIISLFKGIKKESLVLGIRFPRGSLKEEMFGEVYTKKRLPFDINGEDNVSAVTAIPKIATQYIDAVDQFDSYGWNLGRLRSEELQKVVPDKVNEEKSRRIMAAVHNLQSAYDNCLKNAAFESRHEELKTLRACISMSLHLLSMVNWLSHLYQRHLRTNSHGIGMEEIWGIIDQKKILDIMINFSLFYAGEYFHKGKSLANNILANYVEVETCEIGLPVKMGMHLRPASLVAKLAMHHGTKLTLIVDKKEFDASNVLSITIASGLISQRGYKKACFRGDKLVINDLKLLAEYNYGEDEKGNQAPLPPELAHLRG